MVAPQGGGANQIGGPMQYENLATEVAPPNQVDALARPWTFAAMPGPGGVRSGIRTRPNCSQPTVRVGADHDAPRTTNVLIVDDYALHRDNLASIFAATGSGDVAVAWDLESLCVALESSTLDVVLVNVAVRHGVSLLREVFAVNRE